MNFSTSAAFKGLMKNRKPSRIDFYTKSSTCDAPIILSENCK